MSPGFSTFPTGSNHCKLKPTSLGCQVNTDTSLQDTGFSRFGFPRG